jgi:hypothetical protein
MKPVILLVALACLIATILPAVNTPIDLEIFHSGNQVTISWDAVTGATAYKVYVSGDPYGTYTLDTDGSFLTTTSWTKTETAGKKFYVVSAEKLLTPVELGMSGDFVILAETGISTIPSSAITGDIGVSPYTASSLTGFALIMDLSGTFSTSTQVTGSVYASDYLSPTPNILATAVGDMVAAYDDAAGRTTPDLLNLGSGDISGLTLYPGLYKWGTGVLINQNVTLAGGPNDVWIFQIGEGLTMGSGASVMLSGGALPKNIFWQAAGVVALNTTAHLEGIVLCQSAITLATGATVNGRLLSQTAVTMDQSTVTQPTP